MNRETLFEENLSFRNFLAKTFTLMSVGVGITAVMAMLTTRFIYILYSVPFLPFTLFAVEMFIVIYFSRRLDTLSRSSAYALFICYSILNGVMLSSIFYVYDLGSLALAFAVSCLLFASMAIIGHTTRIDLTKYSNLFFIGLIVIILGSLLNFLFKSSMLEWLFTVAGVVLFLGLIAFDIQRLRHFYNAAFSDSEMAEKFVVYGALQLYLDFINLFLRILSLFGRRRNN